MNTFTTLYLTTVLHLLLLPTSPAVNTPPYTPTYYVLLDCGSSSNTTSIDGRNWDGDANSKFSLSNTTLNSSSPSNASNIDPSVPTVPFLTARIFHSSFTYTFPVTAGPKFIRLYFYPCTYSGLDPSQSFFSVTSNHYTLLSNFSAFLTVTSAQQSYQMFTGTVPPLPTAKKEFIINLKDNQTLLNITFSPSPNSYAFINGIELVSMPENLYHHGNDAHIPLVGEDYLYYFDNNTVLETLYRLNVGGDTVDEDEDTGMFRTWDQDKNYMFSAAQGLELQTDVSIHYTSATPAYTAPEIVYNSARMMGNFSLMYNLTWFFGVDSGFFYLVRLHFCEFQMELTKVNMRVFNIYLNNQTAMEAADVIAWSGGNGIPVYGDFVVWVPDVDGRRSKQDLWLVLYPNLDAHPLFYDVILNGLELFKLNQSDGSLAGTNPNILDSETPKPNPKLRSTGSTRRWLKIVVDTSAGVAGLLLLAVLVTCYIKRKYLWRRKTMNDQNVEAFFRNYGSHVPKRYYYSDIKRMTNSFRDKLGQGGYGTVYKGKLLDGKQVAVKVLSETKGNGEEFINEVATISRTSHVNVVTFLGFCYEKNKKALVYEFMSNGSLDKFINNNGSPNSKCNLDCKTLYQIAVGVARGLEYLHRGCSTRIVHFDIKPQNILLDDDFCPKIADFGLAKLGQRKKSIMSMVGARGTVGYIAPEVFSRNFGRVSYKSDVYSYGMMVLEIIGGKKEIVAGTIHSSQESFSDCIYKWLEQNEDLNGTVTTEEEKETRRKMTIVSLWCIQTNPANRPSMTSVVEMLEGSLQSLQIPPKPILSSPPVFKQNSTEIVPQSSSTD
ncbi:probable receptor-like protein kinase At5g39030 [Cornus florida]|uniref:probable receptor-like protein kinase At5g39030 n=1 Tax=Cornus florida TaxID=4283 RepID=UPI002897E200|nr:probable receptor-like protein kinase At5g39030 [Cornus florida]